jgi:hypothetical protein
MQTVSSGSVTAETTDRWVDATGRRVRPDDAEIRCGGSGCGDQCGQCGSRAVTGGESPLGIVGMRRCGAVCRGTRGGMGIGPGADFPWRRRALFAAIHLGDTPQRDSSGHMFRGAGRTSRGGWDASRDLTQSGCVWEYCGKRCKEAVVPAGFDEFARGGEGRHSLSDVRMTLPAMSADACPPRNMIPAFRYGPAHKRASTPVCRRLVDPACRLSPTAICCRVPRSVSNDRS